MGDAPFDRHFSSRPRIAHRAFNTVRRQIVNNQVSWIAERLVGNNGNVMRFFNVREENGSETLALSGHFPDWHGDRK